MTDRASQIIAELNRCTPAVLSGENIESVYLPADALGKIIAFSLDMRLREERLRAELERLSK